MLETKGCPAEGIDDSRFEVFTVRCDARALLWSEGLIDLHSAVDELQAAAEITGVVRDIGQDAVQAIIGNAFRRWRIEC